MSYGVHYYFKENQTDKDVLQFIEKINGTLFKKSVISQLVLDYRLSDITNKLEFKKRINSLFPITITYWEKEKLMGVFSTTSIVSQLKEDMGFKDIYFQNSSDTNYALAEYGGVKVFEDMFNELYKKTDKELSEILKEKGLESYLDVFYNKEEIIYLIISRDFHIEDTLYFNESENISIYCLKLNLTDKELTDCYEIFKSI